MRARTLVPPAVAVALLLSGCGGSGGTTSTAAQAAPTTVSTAMESPTESASGSATESMTGSPSESVKGPMEPSGSGATSGGSAADEATARKLVLAQADIPTGWVAKPASPQSPEGQALEDEIDACVGVQPYSQIRAGYVAGSTFSRANDEISTDVAVLKDSKVVQRYFSGLVAAKNFPCIKKVFDKGLQAAFAASDPTAKVSTTVSVPRGITSGPNQMALRLTSVVTTQGQKKTLYSDLLGLHAGRFQVEISLTYPGTPPTASLDRSLLVAAAAHAAHTSTV